MRTPQRTAATLPHVSEPDSQPIRGSRANQQSTRRLLPTTAPTHSGRSSTTRPVTPTRSSQLQTDTASSNNLHSYNSTRSRGRVRPAADQHTNQAHYHYSTPQSQLLPRVYNSADYLIMNGWTYLNNDTNSSTGRDHSEANETMSQRSVSRQHTAEQPRRDAEHVTRDAKHYALQPVDPPRARAAPATTTSAARQQRTRHDVAATAPMHLCD